MAKRYIDVVTKHPGEDFCQTRIENSLEALQDFVGGYIEVVTINPYACIICNEIIVFIVKHKSPRADHIPGAIVPKYLLFFPVILKVLKSDLRVLINSPVQSIDISIY